MWFLIADFLGCSFKIVRVTKIASQLNLVFFLSGLGDSWAQPMSGGVQQAAALFPSGLAGPRGGEGLRMH